METTSPRARGRVNPLNARVRHALRAAGHVPEHTAWAAAANLPAAYDCRALVTPIKDQGQCGSCWDFSGTCIIESALIAAKILPDNSAASQLSEQYTLDQCHSRNGGCSGDDNTTVLSDATTGGLPLTTAYGPYRAAEGRCHVGHAVHRPRPPVHITLYKILDWGFVGSQSGVPPVNAIKAAMLACGPLGAAIAADDAFERWGDNPANADKPFPGSRSQNIDHDIVLVGWDDARNAWLLRNSWGPDWGNGGYIWIDYAANLVGYEAVWAVASPTPTPPPTTAVAAHAGTLAVAIALAILWLIGAAPCLASDCPNGQCPCLRQAASAPAQPATFAPPPACTPPAVASPRPAATPPGLQRNFRFPRLHPFKR